jgi:hypothetical protein
MDAGFGAGTRYIWTIPAADAQHDNLAMRLMRRVPKLVTIAKHNLVSD